MNRRARWQLAVVAITAALLLCGCQPATDPALLGELQGLRHELAQRRPPAADAAAAREALAPMLTALQELAAQQDLLRQQQAAMAGEWQRLVTLLAARGGADADALTAMQRRLQELEQQQQRAAENHAALRETIQRSLQNTAARLEQFLKVLEGGGDNASGPATPAGEAQPNAPANEPRRGSTGYVPQTWRDRLTPLALVLLGSGVVLAGYLAWRLRGPSVRPSAAAATLPAVDSPDEIWQAAAMLSEAVERLRGGNEAAPSPALPLAPVMAPAPVLPPDHEPFADLAAALAAEPLPPAAVVEQRAPAPPAAMPAPPRVAPPIAATPVATFQAPCPRPADAVAIVRRVLQNEPRVLRRPAPEISHDARTVRATFHLVPALTVADRQHVQYRLQEALQQVGSR